MRRWTLPLLAALAAAGLAGCDQPPPQTRVLSRGPSLPDDTVLKGPTAAASAPAPAAAASAPAPVAAASAPAPVAQAAPPAAAETNAMGAAPAASAPGAPAASDGSAAPTEMTRALQPGAAASAARARDKVSTGDPEGAQLLAQHALQVPVVGVQPTALSDNYLQSRGQRTHEAIDILAPAGTPVVAVDDGRIAKLFTSKAGGLTIYQFDREGRLAYYYAHLQGYAPGVKEGMDVRRGELVGYVGSSGNADVKTPHLHFSVFRLGTPARWWQGEAVNPYPALSRAQPTVNVAGR